MKCPEELKDQQEDKDAKRDIYISRLQDNWLNLQITQRHKLIREYPQLTETLERLFLLRK